MSPRDFLDLAEELAAGVGEASWRSGVSRAYYGAFHVARELAGAGFRPPEDQRMHAYLWLRLSNAGHPDVQDAGRRLRALREARTRADYDLRHPLPVALAAQQVDEAVVLTGFLDDLAGASAVLARVVDAIRTYEREVLQDVTWRAGRP